MRASRCVSPRSSTRWTSVWRRARTRPTRATRRSGGRASRGSARTRRAASAAAPASPSTPPSRTARATTCTCAGAARVRTFLFTLQATLRIAPALRSHHLFFHLPPAVGTRHTPRAEFAGFYPDTIRDPVCTRCPGTFADCTLPVHAVSAAPLLVRRDRQSEPCDRSTSIVVGDGAECQVLRRRARRRSRASASHAPRPTPPATASGARRYVRAMSPTNNPHAPDAPREPPLPTAHSASPVRR